MHWLYADSEQILELLVQRDKEFQELMQTAVEQGKVQQEMQALQKDVEKRDSDIQQLQKQLKEAEHILVTEPMHVYFSNIQLQICVWHDIYESVL